MKRLLIALFSALLIALSALALAQPSGGDYVITRSTHDGGGGTASGGSYTLTGTIGQPDASPLAATGGDFQVRGGFWVGILGGLIFKDSFEDE